MTWNGAFSMRMYWPTGLRSANSFPGLFANHCHCRAGGFVGLGEETALRHWPVEYLREVGVGAADIELQVLVAIAHTGLAAIDGHDHAHLGQGGDGAGVVQGDDAFRRPGGGWLAVEVDDVGAEGAHLRHDLALAAFTHCQHDHHRRHADDDAQQRQCGAEAVDPHHPPRRLDGVQQFAFPGTVVLAAVVQALAQVDGLQHVDLRVRSGQWLRLGLVADDLAIADFDDALGPCGDFPVVGDEDHHMALAGQFVEQGHDFGTAAAVEGAGGFVCQNDVATVHQRAGYRYALLLAAGQLVRAITGTFGQAQAGQQGMGACVALGGRRAGIDRRHFDIFLGGAGGNQVIALEHETEGFTPQPGECVTVQAGHLFTREQVVATGGAVQAAEDVHQRRLA